MTGTFSCLVHVLPVAIRIWLGDPDVAMVENGRKTAQFSGGSPRYEKEWKNSQRHGVWRDFDKAGHLRAEYFYEEGKPAGLWRRWWPSGKLASSGGYKNGLAEGEWKAWAENGMPIFTGEFRAGQADGMAIDRFPDSKSKTIGLWKNGKHVKAWAAWHMNGQKSFEGTYNDAGQEHGLFRYWLYDGELLKSQRWENGKLLEEKMGATQAP
ncbi:MAG TPA: hypothetical protein VIH99_02785 [Bdellovibrionota bacterium]|jgi:antitoxin component YwqK of YwqJK toxin-antitoxin module